MQEESGRSKPPSVWCGIQLSAIPGRTPDRPYALFWLAPAGIHRFIVSRRYVQRVAQEEPAPLAPVWGLDRFITDGGPYRFCVIAVTLATRTCVRLRVWPVGGLSSAAQDVPPSAALSLSPIMVSSWGYISVRVCHLRNRKPQRKRFRATARDPGRTS